VPDALGDQVRVGTVVRVQLHGRRIGAWVVAEVADPAPGLALKPIAKVTGWGPTRELLDLADWAAWRWAGRRASFLRSATADRAVPTLPAGGGTPARAPSIPLVEQALARPRSVVRLPPATDVLPLVLGAAARGNTLVVAPSAATAERLARGLRSAGATVARAPEEWARARAGATVVGARAAAWAPMIDLAAVVVVDEHDEAHQQEQAPTWHARDVAAERARRAAVPCVVTSPVPTLEALAWGELVTPSRAEERRGWPLVEVIDRRGDDPRRGGVFSERLTRGLPAAGRIVCVLNRRGRSRLLACTPCGAVARCARCDAAVSEPTGGTLACHRCGTQRPLVCLACGSSAFKNLRVGVHRAREELEALLREPVAEVSADVAALGDRPARVLVGTEAVLHRVEAAAVVAFLDFDQELLAPRSRAAEQALALLVRAARLVGGRGAGRGRIVVQTRVPEHEVVQAALHADPTRVATVEAARRHELRFPPVTALAVVSGVAAPDFIEAFGRPLGVEVMGPTEGRWLLRADEHATLLDALAATPRPPGRVRVEVDPLRV
jgi:primosomal protein N' (replication factor Y) (superfamily II helicase)